LGTVGNQEKAVPFSILLGASGQFLGNPLRGREEEPDPLEQIIDRNVIGVTHTTARATML
jgi:hypothetical protein